VQIYTMIFKSKIYNNLILVLFRRCRVYDP